MSEQPPLLDRLKRARIVQVLAVYLGASWVVLQIADVLQGAVGLPAWVSAFAVLLLLIGLVIILATAWVQAMPSTTAREAAGEIPTDWQIAPADALDSLKEGRLPHLTWGRAILGGVVALSLLFGGTGLYVGLTGRTSVLGPREVGAGEAATGIAVVPFTVTGGEDLALWREGMVDVLATNLDGMGGFRTIDARTVMAKWRSRVSPGEEPELRTALEVAGETGARYALVGNMVGSPAGLRLSADIYDLSTGQEVVQATQEGAAEDVLDLTSALSVELTRELLEASGQNTVQDLRLGGLTTTSLPALRAYLEAEAMYRSADFAGAVSGYERAVELDSLFALAWHRLANAYGWLEDIGSEAGARAGTRSMELADRLPARDRLLVRASEATRTGDVRAYTEVRDGVQRYPDDPDLWFELGEYIYHVGLTAGQARLPQAVEAFERAVELDPRFGPYQVHLLELTIASGDYEGAEARFEQYRESTNEQFSFERFEIALPLLLGDAAAADRAIGASLDVDMGELVQLRLAFQNRTDRYDRLGDLEWANRHRAGADHQWFFYMLGAQGAIERAARVTDSLDISAISRTLGAGWMLANWETARDMRIGELATSRGCDQPQRDTQCHMFLGWGQATSGDLAGAKSTLALLREHAAAGSSEANIAARTRMADVVDGTIAAVEGRVADARRLLGPIESGGGNPGSLARQTLGELEYTQGNVSEAIDLLSGNLYDYGRSRATLELARIHDQRGDTEQARAFYRSFVTMTQRGDDLPEIREARAALERLGDRRERPAGG
jgi:tetratricopeptide (TPR) repeat protein